MKRIAIQPEFRQGLPNIQGNRDYIELLDRLERIDELISGSGLEEAAQEEWFAAEERRKRIEIRKAKAHGKSAPKFIEMDIEKRIKWINKSVRCSIGRHLTGDTFRDFSCRAAESAVWQRFIGIDRIDAIHVPSKSTMERMENEWGTESLHHWVHILTKAGMESESNKGDQGLELENPIKVNNLYVDTTAVSANIHPPVDWVFLKDAARTLMKAVQLIRAQGLKRRMAEPQTFLKEFNRLSIQMTHTRRSEHGRAEGKRIFRKMKKLLRKIERHGQQHYNLLKRRWQETDWKQGAVKQILKRMKNVLGQVPWVIKQGHERIIGGRQVLNSKKVLSIYDPDIHVIVRGKANAEVEFGNTLRLGEQEDGIIVDWNFYAKQAPPEKEILKELLDALEKVELKADSVTTDRGFSSPKTSRDLEQRGIENCVCPKSPKAMRNRMLDESFQKNQGRRSQTEGRIGIVKNNFFGRPMRSKGFLHRDLNVGWGILAHNLWVIARLPQKECEEPDLARAA